MRGGGWWWIGRVDLMLADRTWDGEAWYGVGYEIVVVSGKALDGLEVRGTMGGRFG